MSHSIPVGDYRSAIENDEGWCTTCQAFTRSMVEPDAEEYNCPECEEDAVMGAELAVIVGEITVEYA